MPLLIELSLILKKLFSLLPCTYNPEGFEIKTYISDIFRTLLVLSPIANALYKLKLLKGDIFYTKERKKQEMVCQLHIRPLFSQDFYFSAAAPFPTSLQLIMIQYMLSWFTPPNVCV